MLLAIASHRQKGWSWYKAYASVMGRFKRLDEEYLDGPYVYQLRMVKAKGHG